MQEKKIEPDKKNRIIVDDKIDLVELAKTLWRRRRTIVKSVVIAGVLGVMVAIISPDEYTATTTIVPQTADAKSGLGGLSGLAAMAGFNLNVNEGSILSPTLYPQILSSIPFKLELMETPLSFEAIDQPVTLVEYYGKIKKASTLSLIKKYTIGLPQVFFKNIRSQEPEESALKKENCIQLTEDEQVICEILDEKVTLEFNDEEGYLILTGKMPEARAAAQLTQKAELLLQQYITEFKVEKALAQKEFIEQRFNEKKKEFEAAQEALAKFRDEHKNVTSALTRTKEERLIAEYNMLFSVYTELAKQLEQAKIQIKEDTPVFTIIEPVMIPFEKSAPKRKLLVLGALILGAFIGIVIVISKSIISEIS